MDGLTELVALPDSPKAFNSLDVFCIAAWIKHLGDWTNDHFASVSYQCHRCHPKMLHRIYALKDKSSDQTLCAIVVIIIIIFVMIIITLIII